MVVVGEVGSLLALVGLVGRAGLAVGLRRHHGLLHCLLHGLCLHVLVLHALEEGHLDLSTSALAKQAAKLVFNNNMA